VFEDVRQPAVVGLSAMAGRKYERYVQGTLRFGDVLQRSRVPKLA
jgi:hypothetical protein